MHEPITQPLASPAGAIPVEMPSHLDQFQPLAPQFIVLEQRTGYVFSLVVAAVSLVASQLGVWLSGQSAWVILVAWIAWLALAGVLFWSSHVWPNIEYKHTSWRVTEVGMEIRRGVLWKHRIAIPLARVQHVDVSQGPIQRMFDLGTLTIHTAGTSGASIELSGLSHAQALQLRDHLIVQKESLDVT